MKGGAVVFAAMLAISTAVFAKANGAWLKKVPEADHARTNPYAGQPDAIAAGRVLYHDNCAKCHGEQAQGKYSRPSLVSEQLRNATDGDIAWILKNGEIYKGMPGWAGLTEQKRWQLVTFIRSLNPPAGAQK